MIEVVEQKSILEHGTILIIFIAALLSWIGWSIRQWAKGLSAHFDEIKKDNTEIKEKANSIDKRLAQVEVKVEELRSRERE